MPCNGSTTHHSDALRALEAYRLGSSGAMKEGYTSGLWLENESIIMEVPMVSEVATNHWLFSKVWSITLLYLILLPILS